MNLKKITITITNAHNNKFNALSKNSRINAITKSAILDLALAKFFENATVNSIESELSNQIIGDV